jgi:hypothetical protein
MQRSPLDDTDDKAAKAQATAQADAERTFIEDFKWLMSSPRGRRLMKWLLELTGVYRTSFNNSGSITAFNEGQRNIGLALMAQLNDHCLDRYVEMLNEQRTTK